MAKGRIAGCLQALPNLSVTAKKETKAVDKQSSHGLKRGGLSPRELLQGLRIVAQRGFLGFDLVEVAPELDNPGGTTSVLASRIITEALGFMALARSQR